MSTQRTLPPRFALRLALVIAQLLAVYWFGEQGALFIYQGF